MKSYERSEKVLGRILEEKAGTNQGKVFVRYKDQELTYDQVNERANRVGNGLAGLGVKKGDKVGIFLPNCPEYLYLWFGLAKIGGVEVVVNTAFRGPQLRHVLDSSDVSLLVVDERFLDRVEFLQDELKSLKRVIVFPSGEEKGGIARLKFEQIPFEVLYRGSPESPQAEVKASDLIAIMHTSGTTGPSKGVMLSHCQQYQLGWITAKALRMGPEDIFYSYYPYFHNTAQAHNTCSTLLADASLIMRDRFSASSYWEDIKKYRCTVTYTIGFILDILLKQPPKADDAEHPLRASFCIGGSRETYETYEKRFRVVLIEGYGSTEANVPVVNPYDKRKLGSCGLVAPEWEVKVFDENDDELPPGKVGEIVVRPREPFTMLLGYYGMEKTTLEAFRNLWYHSGDAGFFDEEGYLYFVDRVKDVIRKRGEFISSYDVEAAINTHPSVLESAAIGIPSPEFKGEQEVKAVVVLKEGCQLSPEELISFCEKRIAYFAVPRFLEFKEKIPKTPTEKMEKHKLKAEGITAATWDREKAGYKLKR